MLLACNPHAFAGQLHVNWPAKWCFYVLKRCVLAQKIEFSNWKTSILLPRGLLIFSILTVFKSRFKGKKTDKIFYNSVERDELGSAPHK